MNEQAVLIMFIIGTASVTGFVGYAIFHDTSVDARLIAEGDSCEDLKWKLDRQHKKIMENMFTPVLREVYNERNCDVELALEMTDLAIKMGNDKID